MRRSGPHEPLEGSGLKFQYRTNAAFSLLGGPKPVSQEAGVTPLTSPAFSKRRGSGAASSAGGNRLSLGAASSEPVVLKLSELMAQTQASRTMLTSKESNPILTQTASLTANGLDSFHTIFDSPAAVAAALALTPAVAGGAETSTVSTPVFSRSGNGGSSTAMEEFYAVPKPVELKPQGATSAAPVGLRGVAAAEGAAAVGNEEDTKAVLALGQKPKWMREVSRISSPMLRLHQEVLELCELLQPTEDEAAGRNAAVAAVTDVVKSIWPNATVAIFGSFATGLYVPTSDIDLVVEHSNHGNINRALHALANGISRKGIAKSVQVISKAKVPIIKFETIEHGGLAFDVSFDVANGPEAAGLVKQLTGLWPMMRPLILILKLFLQQRELNEVYTGGIGSYALITMVTAFLQLHTSRRKSPPPGGARQGRGGGPRGQQAGSNSVAEEIEGCLGVLLIDFFRFYSRVLNLSDVGVSIAAGGCCFGKGSKDWANYERPYLLAVEDPADPTNDVCRSSFNIMRVKTAFEYAYQVMTTPCERDESLLCRILRLGPVLASRPSPPFHLLLASSYYLAQSLPLPASLQTTTRTAQLTRLDGMGGEDGSGASQGSDEPMSKKQRRKSTQAAAAASLSASLREADEIAESLEMELEEEGAFNGDAENLRLARAAALHEAKRVRRHGLKTGAVESEASKKASRKEGRRHEQDELQAQQQAQQVRMHQLQHQQRQQSLQQQQQQPQQHQPQQRQQHQQMSNPYTTEEGFLREPMREGSSFHGAGEISIRHQQPVGPRGQQQQQQQQQQYVNHSPAPMSVVRRVQSDQPMMTVASAMRHTMSSPAVSNAYRAPYHQGMQQPSPFPPPGQQGRASAQGVWGRLGGPVGNGQQQQQAQQLQGYRQTGGQAGGHKYFQ